MRAWRRLHGWLYIICFRPIPRIRSDCKTGSTSSKALQAAKKRPTSGNKQSRAAWKMKRKRQTNTKQSMAAARCTLAAQPSPLQRCRNGVSSLQEMHKIGYRGFLMIQNWLLLSTRFRSTPRRPLPHYPSRGRRQSTLPLLCRRRVLAARPTKQASRARGPQRNAAQNYALPHRLHPASCTLNPGSSSARFVYFSYRSVANTLTSV